MSRQIDELVAIHVMGYRKATEAEPYWNSLAVWIDQGGERWEDINNYSTDIADAWQVVEQLHGRVVIDHWFPGDYKVMIYIPSSNRPSVEASAPTAPLAICLAALKAVGIEVPAE